MTSIRLFSGDLKVTVLYFSAVNCIFLYESLITISLRGLTYVAVPSTSLISRPNKSTKDLTLNLPNIGNLYVSFL